MRIEEPTLKYNIKSLTGYNTFQKSGTLMKMKNSFSKLSLSFILILNLNFSFSENINGQAQSPYCSTLVSHFPADIPDSKMILTIQNTGANTMEVRAESSPANPKTVDDLFIPPFSGVTISYSNPSPGVYVGTLTFAPAPVNASFNVLWSTSDFPGFWQLSAANVTIPFDAVCSGTPPPPPPTAPTMAAPTPTCPSGSVISMFSNAYTNVPVDTWRTVWSQNPGILTDLQIAGNDTKKYEDVTFIGIETVNTPIDASTMKYLHMDVWSPNFTQFRVKLVDLGPDGTFAAPNPEHEVTFTAPAQGTWVKYQIPLSDFTNLTSRSKIAQLILSAMPNGQADFFIDNVYFSTCDLPSAYCNTEVRHLGASAPAEAPSAIKLSVGNTGPNSITVEIESTTASPVDLLLIDGPAGGAAISETVVVAPGKLRRIFRWATPPANVTFNVLWSKADFGGNWLLNQVSIPFIAVCPTLPQVPIAPTTAAPLPTCPSDQVISLFSNSYPNVPVSTFLTPWSQQPVTLTNTQVAGNDVKYYQNVTFLGIETFPTTIDASAMNTLHIDFWSANATQFRIKLVDLGPDGSFAAPNPEHELTFNNPTLGEWVSYEIPLSMFTGLTSRTKLAQYILSGMPDGAVDFYIDNIYFSNCALPSGWSEQAVNCPGTNYSYNPTTQVYTGTSVNCYYPNSFVSDELSSAQRQLCGNGTITAKVTSITGSALGWAGITMRENNAAGAKKAQLMTNLSEFSRREFRTTTGGTSYPQQFPSQSRYWLRITRTGNQFTMFISPNGTSWFPAGSQTIIMPECIQVGLIITNYTENSTVTAKFSNVSVTGGIPTKPNDTGNLKDDLVAGPDFTVMPNPTSGFVEINMSAYNNNNVQMEIYNLQGKLIRSATIDTIRGIEEVDMSSFVNGMYIIRMKAEGLPDVTKRIVVQH